MNGTDWERFSKGGAWIVRKGIYEGVRRFFCKQAAVHHISKPIRVFAASKIRTEIYEVFVGVSHWPCFTNLLKHKIYSAPGLGVGM